MSEKEPQLNSAEEFCKHGMLLDWCADCKTAKTRPAKKVIHLKNQKRKSRSRQRQIEGISVLSKGDEPGSLSSLETAVHLVPLPSIRLLKDVMDTCPNLHTIQVPPSTFQRFFASETPHKKLLEEKGISIISGSWIEKRPDLDQRDDRLWEDRRDFLNQLKNNHPETYEIYQRSKMMGFDEITLTESYFCLERPRPPRKSLVDLGAEVGINFNTARAKILGLLAILGYPSEEESILISARSFKKRYQQAIEAEKEAQERAKYEKYQPLPPRLPSIKFGEFLELTRIQAEEPEKIEALPERKRTTLEFYFGLKDGVHRKLRTIAANAFERPLTHQCISVHLRDALRLLGIEEK